MPTTITAYTTFTTGPAFSSQVDANFSNHRGTLIPINTDTVSAGDLTHHLGQSDHRWDQAFVRELMLSDVTTTGLKIRGGSNGTQIDLYVGNATTSSVDANGIKWPSRVRGVTIAAGDIFRSGATSSNATGGITITGTFISGGNPFVITLIALTQTAFLGVRRVGGGATSGNFKVTFTDNGSAIGVYRAALTVDYLTATVFYLQSSIFQHLRFAAAGTHSLTIELLGWTITADWTASALQAMAYEL